MIHTVVLAITDSVNCWEGPEWEQLIGCQLSGVQYFFLPMDRKAVTSTSRSSISDDILPLICDNDDFDSDAGQGSINVTKF